MDPQTDEVGQAHKNLPIILQTPLTISIRVGGERIMVNIPFSRFPQLRQR